MAPRDQFDYVLPATAAAHNISPQAEQNQYPYCGGKHRWIPSCALEHCTGMYRTHALARNVCATRKRSVRSELCPTASPNAMRNCFALSFVNLAYFAKR